MDVEPLPDRPGAGVDADEWSFHHRVLYRLVLGASGSTTEELQMLYDAIAPVAYYGTTETACARRYRRKLLNDLRDAALVDAHETPRGRVWTPTENALAGATHPEAEAQDVVEGDDDA